MKAVQLIRYSKHDDRYTIYLGNGTAHHFTSQKSCKAFLSSTNKFLTNFLHEAHEAYINTWVLYQNYWFYFKHNKPSMTAQRFIDDHRCKKELDGVAEMRHLIISRCQYTNGNYFVFSHFRAIMKNLKTVLNILETISKKRSDTNTLYKIYSVHRIIAVLETDLNQYGVKEARFLFEVPKILNTTTEWQPKMHVA
ncbi:hypothetical protein JYU20_00405 [Bacteroidales bacterium AH-315-I05]|nr:hypothetical protein [Bacteroidales bacterium AH-315-I05]